MSGERPCGRQNILYHKIVPRLGGPSPHTAASDKIHYSTPRTRYQKIESYIHPHPSPLSCILAPLHASGSSRLRFTRRLPNRVPPSPHALPQPIQHRHRHLPRDTSVGHGLTPFEACTAGGRDVLSAFDEVGFEHDAHDHRGGIGRFELLCLFEEKIMLKTNVDGEKVDETYDILSNVNLATVLL